MPSTDFDDIELLEDPDSDSHVRLNKADVDRMRKAAKSSSAIERELAEYKRKDAIRSAGLGDLNDRQVSKLSKLVDDPTPENLRAEAEELGWVQPKVDPDAPTAEELQAHADIAAAGTGAAATSSAVATAEDVGGWGVDKRMRFYNQHPDLHESLLRGEQITVPAAFL